MDQDSFEAGINLGLKTATFIIRSGKGLGGIERLMAEMEAVKRRRSNEAPGRREMLYSDIFLLMPLAHPADFGISSPMPEREVGE